jgi:hypothetical protein
MPFLASYELGGICTLLPLTASMAIYSKTECARFTRYQLIVGEEQAGLVVVINCGWKDKGA